MAEPSTQPETVRLVDYYGLQAVAFLADPELCFDVGSIDSLNRILEVFIRQLVDLSSREVSEGPVRTIDASVVTEVMEQLNIKPYIE